MTSTLQELADRREIEDQVIAYAYAVDFHRWDDLDAIFTEDATLDFTATGGERGTLAEIKGFFDRALNLFQGHQHLMTNVQVSFGEDGQSATSRTACHNPMYLAGADGQQHVMFVGIWYLDTWRRTPDGWRIAAREQQKGYLHGL
jgi:3-phenylpropionate/cinnamic acid dioxygenase small subunit